MPVINAPHVDCHIKVRLCCRVASIGPGCVVGSASQTATATTPRPLATAHFVMPTISSALGSVCSLVIQQTHSSVSALAITRGKRGGGAHGSIPTKPKAKGHTQTNKQTINRSKARNPRAPIRGGGGEGEREIRDRGGVWHSFKFVVACYLVVDCRVVQDGRTDSRGRIPTGPSSELRTLVLVILLFC